MDTLDILSSIDQPPARAGLRQEIVRGLLHSIFRGDLPAQTRLVILRLAERFGTSSTPVREALVELEGFGIVEFIHNRGAMVKPFGRDELREIYHFRRILEAEATRCACGRIGTVTLESLEEKLSKLADPSRRRQSFQDMVAVDQQLHALIATACGNQRIAQEIKKLNTLFQVIREIVGVQRGAQEQAVVEHLAVIRAMLADDANAAAEAMARHVNNSAEVALAAMFPK
ncbi:MAG: GntR family transcriptional regulator [Pirellulales bacterium]|nr:GntR family transcriptional regulator [Pirellulales bacterium]